VLSGASEPEEKCGACHPDAHCRGRCCACAAGFVGNGHFCRPGNATAVSVVGRVSGRLNQQRLADLDLFAYAQTRAADSGSFLVVRQIPAHLAASFQALVSLANPIAWLFASANGFGDQVANGFAITGG
jgi:hypothetical protein